MFWLDSDVGVITFIAKKGCNTGGSAWGIVVSEFGKRDDFRPVILLILSKVGYSTT